MKKWNGQSRVVWIAIVTLSVVWALSERSIASTLIGESERVEFRVMKRRVKVMAKVDTGADGTVLHATNIRPFQRRGKTYVRFHTFQGQEVLARVIDTKHIRSSNGQLQERWIVRTKLCLGKILLNEPVSLADRSQMEFPALIGKSVLRGKYAVDVGTAKLLGDPQCAESPR